LNIDAFVTYNYPKIASLNINVTCFAIWIGNISSAEKLIIDFDAHKLKAPLEEKKVGF